MTSIWGIKRSLWRQQSWAGKYHHLSFPRLKIHTLPETNPHLPWKLMVGRRNVFLSKWHLFRGHVSFRGSTSLLLERNYDAMIGYDFPNIQAQQNHFKLPQEKNVKIAWLNPPTPDFSPSFLDDQETTKETCVPPCCRCAWKFWGAPSTCLGSSWRWDGSIHCWKVFLHIEEGNNFTIIFTSIRLETHVSVCVLMCVGWMVEGV